MDVPFLETLRRDRKHRAWVGPPEKYDLMAATQFSLLTHLGLREHHSLLDIGCGSLRAGRLFIAYLLPDRYFGIEPEAWVLEEGIRRELGRDLVRLKRPEFSHVADFSLSTFERTFDFILAQSVFSHAARAQIERCLSEAANVLAPGGVLAATYVDGPEDYPGTEWVYPGLAPYRAATMRGLVEAAGLVFDPLAWPHPNDQRWFAAYHPSDQQPGGPRFVDMYARLQAAEAALTRIARHPLYRAYRAVRRPFRRG